MTNTRERQYLSVRISLAVLAVGFILLGLLSLTNRQHGELLAATALENTLSVLGGLLSILAGGIFLIAGCFYWTKTPQR